ncbi:MAG: zinc metallopeptidase [Planctomycetes bacterium]|nr:zinc metallopeptidase [Planctomycetota bacterium]
MFYFDPRYLVMLAPAFLLAMWAQWRVHATYAAAQRLPAPLSGAAAARHVLNSAGLYDVAIEQVPGHLSDHYDPRHKVLRLSTDVYQSRSLAAVGIAAHEAGHAIQDARAYAPLVIRNAAVPAANFGSGFSFFLFFIGILFHLQALVWVGVALFGAVAFFQVVNLPVEFNASSRAKEQLVALGIISPQELTHVSSVLNAVAWTYVAATLQSLLTLLYYILRASAMGGRDDR